MPEPAVSTAHAIVDAELVVDPAPAEPWLPVVAPAGTAAALSGAGIAAGMLTGWLAPSFGVFTAAAAVILAVSLVVLSYIDLRIHRLPDAIVLPLYGVFLAAHTLAAMTGEIGWDRYWLSVACMAGAFAVFYVLAVLTGMGAGDMKLAGVLGLALGVYGVGHAALGALFLPVAVGGIVAFALLLLGRPGKSEMAFGPFMALGAMTVLAFPQVPELFTTGLF